MNFALVCDLCGLLDKNALLTQRPLWTQRNAIEDSICLKKVVFMKLTDTSFRSIFYAVILIAAHAVWAAPMTALDLSGEWRFALDPTNIGVSQNWFGPKETRFKR